ncbi:uncharacterized protein LOC110442199 [Mizuhopecten yessoensis]|uniref:uncharacterized protein LOC110442199 n=1 Tax=Mizuhopecten yessoensis TaxID=6573 RepID=UPI000B45DFB8|nr:uncharacterized protein LOC110442199 [Mizuhopecten yessoensis]
MVKFQKENNGYSYVLVVIDVYSKFLSVNPLKDKTGASATKALREILSEGRQPSRIRTDKGQEYRSQEVNSILNQYHIHHLYTENETKAAVSERVIKTIKSRMYRFFTHLRIYEYVTKLQTFADSYNKMYHMTLGTTPTKVNKNNEISVWWRMYWP